MKTRDMRIRLDHSAERHAISEGLDSILSIARERSSCGVVAQKRGNRVRCVFPGAAQQSGWVSVVSRSAKLVLAMDGDKALAAAR
eukprot:gene16888-biopygen10192